MVTFVIHLMERNAIVETILKVMALAQRVAEKILFYSVGGCNVLSVEIRMQEIQLTDISVTNKSLLSRGCASMQSRLVRINHLFEFL